MSEFTEIRDQLAALSSGELRELQKAIEKVLGDREEIDKRTLFERFKSEAAAIGTSVEHLLEWAKSSAKASSTEKPVPPKYRSPNGELWTGRGRIPPQWMQALLAAGHDKEEFLIDKPAAPVSNETETPVAEEHTLAPEGNEDNSELTPNPPRKPSSKRKTS